MVSSSLPKRAVLLPRGRYHLVLSSFPGLKQSERLRAVEFRLPELYPGSMEDILWESRLLPGPSGAVLSVIAPRRNMKKSAEPIPRELSTYPSFTVSIWDTPAGGKPWSWSTAGA
ncbi:hypothetical protein [Marispirochaeta sp.]|uniref:hypothetical protein n=1 Tax=Marispirochaeta sp. TaxID=2038653 RepID=UPI0029C89A1E|nr:hypothetical protein [Marispirochaeta sp.]